MKPNSLLTHTKSWLRKHRITATKRLGQHFLINESVLTRILDYADIKPDDIVLEIGAGSGTLTKSLAQRAKQVFTIEKDQRIYHALQAEIGKNPNISILQGDAVVVEWPSCDKLVANLPYSISSPVLFKFIDTKIPLAILMLQQEFAQRLASTPAVKNYGRLTVMAAYAAAVELLEVVEPRNFHPQPAVSSALVRITRRPTPPFTVMDYSLFTQLVKALFGQRRKKIRTPLKGLLQRLELDLPCIDGILRRIPWLDQRVEELSPEQLADIANIIHEERMQ